MRLPSSRFWVVAALLVAAMAIRLDGIAGPPLDGSRYSSAAIIIRQYHSALLARAYYLNWRGASTAKDRRLAAGIEDDEKLVEPPLLEGVTAGVYVLTGGERLWIPRLLVAITWLVGGIFLLRLAERITSWSGAVAALAIYLFLPFGIVAGRSFQPDGVMVAALLGACLAAVRYAEQPSRQRFAIATTAAALASLLKPGWALFFVVPVFFSVVAARASIRTALIRTSIYTAIAVVPTAAWIAYGDLVRNFLHGQATDKVNLHLLAHPSTYRGWLQMIGEVLGPSIRAGTPTTGLVLLTVALAATALGLRNGGRLLVPLWIGYATFGAVFATHTRNHNYYSLVLIVIAALAIGAALPRIAEAARMRNRDAALATAISAGVIALAFAAHGGLASPSYGQAAGEFAQVGNRIAHRSVVVLAPNFGEPLEYHGRFRSRWWPTPNNVPASERTITPTERLDGSNSTYWPAPAAMNPKPRYFIADLHELAQQDELRDYLKTLPDVATIDNYAIFALRRGPSNARSCWRPAIPGPGLGSAAAC